MTSHLADTSVDPGPDPVANAILTAVADNVASERSAVGRFVMGVFELQTLQEAERLTVMLATLCPIPANMSVGIWELLANAIEHGNLGISFEEKTELLQKGALVQETNRRLLLPEYADRIVRVKFEQSKSSIRLFVSDDGRGFDFSIFMQEGLATTRPNGRGILMARTVFDHLIYHGCGNEAEATIELRPSA
jgi:hypothetical protein